MAGGLVLILYQNMAKSKIKFFFGSRFLLFCLLLAVIWTGLILIRTFYKKNQLDMEVSRIKSEIEKINKKNTELAQLLDYFQQQDFLEREAKEKLNMKKEGEKVVIVPEASIVQRTLFSSAASSVPAGTQNSVQENNFIKWWRYFFER